VRGLPDVCPVRIEKHEQLVARAVGRMARLIADLLDAAAIDAGRMLVEPREEDAREMLAEAAESLRPLAAARRQDLCVAAPDDLLVVCDHVRILQVLSNLIGNAIKYAGEGRPIALQVERAGRTAHFSIKDSGAGIAPAQLHHLFERYWRASAATSGGTGLGLFLTKGIVQAHGGRVWAESTVGVGSTFHFTLPLQTGTPSPTKSALDPSAARSSGPHRRGAYREPRARPAQ
jgi:signal transduction histidine kinase